MSFTSHMITSLKHNKRKRISAFEKLENFKEGTNIQVHFNKKASKEELNNIKERIQKIQNKKRRRNIILFSIILVLAIYIVGFVKF